MTRFFKIINGRLYYVSRVKRKIKKPKRRNPNYLKYKKDAETSFTTIFTHNTDDSLFHEAVNIESSGATLPEFRELSLRIESTGGAVITGYWAQAEHKPDGLVGRILQGIRGFVGK